MSTDPSPFKPEFPGVRPAVPTSAIKLGTLVVDAEEDFDWFEPLYGTRHSVLNMLNLNCFQEIAAAYGAIPTYLVTYPVLENADVTSRLARLYERSECDLGVQLHAWVTPPFDTSEDNRTSKITHSYAGNLPPELERKKLMTLTSRFRDCFGAAPDIYRAGRYGLGKHTPSLLESMGFIIDTSVAPRTDFSPDGGPDYTDYGYNPFWFGTDSNILELPLCREVVGWAGPLAPKVYATTNTRILSRMRGISFAAWLRCAERITLSPEGNDVGALRRLARTISRREGAVLALSLHSSSLAVGTNPYASSRHDVQHLYDRLSAVLCYMSDDLGFSFRKLRDIRRHFISDNI